MKRAVILALGLALLPAPARADEILVSGGLGPALTAYPRGATGNAPAARLVAGPSTALNAPTSMVFDALHDELVVTNATTQTVSAYTRDANGDAAPLRTLAPSGASLHGAVTATVDAFRDELLVVFAFGQAIATYPRAATGTAPPLRVLSGPSTGLAGPYAVAVDAAHAEIVTSNITSHALTVHARGAGGDVPPLRTIEGANTGLAGPRGVAIDLVHDEIVVVNAAAPSITVYARTASGNVAALRTISGPATSLVLPMGVAIDLVHDEIVVTGGGAVWVFARTAHGDVAPLRTISGPNTSLIAPTAVAVAATAPIFAAVLPSSRSVSLGTTATAFATILNAGSGPVASCGLVPITPLPAVTSFFQTTDPASNLPTRPVNVPAPIAPGGSQSYVFGITPTVPFAPVDVAIGFACEGVIRASVISGLDTFLLVASDTPVADMIAQAATVKNDGIVDAEGLQQSGAFAVATTNVGAAAHIDVTADTNGVALPVSLFVCQTNPASGQCVAPPSESVSADVATGATPTFGVFAIAHGPIAFDPAVNRIFLRFTEGGITRGATSVAIRTP